MHFYRPRRITPVRHSRRRRILLWLLQYALMTAAGVAVGAVSLLLGLGPYPLELAQGYFEQPLILLLNLSIPVVLLFLLFGLTRRASLSFGLTALTVLGFSLGHYYKMTFRDDPLMFADLFTLREAGNMAGKYQLFVDWKVGAAIVCLAVGWLLLKLLARQRLSRGTRTRHVTLFLAASLAFFSYSAFLDDDLYAQTAYYERLNNRWSSTEQYIARGFAYPFLHSISAAIESPPQGYRKATAAAMLDAYPSASIPEDKRVNVVGIMLEAFQDFSRFGVPELSRDIYAGYHELEAESFTGDLVTNIFAGGTVDTERCFLTGYSQLPEFRSNTNAYPWYFRSQGYQVTGMHPCYQWFYNRKNVNAYLGFESYRFVENYFGKFTGGDVAPDDIFFTGLIAELDARQSGAPIFSFSVTYQGHGPYASNPAWWSDLSDYFPENAPYTQEQMGSMANYFGGQENTIANLLRLRDFMAAQTEPYVLVLFGDHNPWMGDGNSIYQAMGLNLDQSTQDGFSNYYSTRYLIWANNAAKQTLGSDFVGEGPAIGPYFLMNQLFALCGWEGPSYLQATNAVARAVPVQHTTGVYLEDGIFTRDLTPEGKALSQDYSWLQYHARQEFLYQDLS